MNFAVEYNRLVVKLLIKTFFNNSNYKITKYNLTSHKKVEKNNVYKFVKSKLEFADNDARKHFEANFNNVYNSFKYTDLF